MFIFLQIILLLIFTLVLVKATDVLIESLNLLVRKTHWGKFAVASFLIGLTTSLPEMVVGIVAALQGKPVLSLGNVIGSNIADIALIVGLSTVVAGVLVEGTITDKEFLFSFSLGMAPLVLLIDKTLSRIDGLILVFIYSAYHFWIFHFQPERRQRHLPKKNFFLAFFNRFWQSQIRHQLTRLLGAVALILFSADMLVRITVALATDLKAPLLLLGFFVITLGTTAPEMIVSLRGSLKGEGSLVLGDILGSIAANSCLVLGLVALIEPIRLVNFQEFMLASLVFALVYLVFYLFVRSQSKLTRLEGLALLSIYLLFVVVELWK